MESYSVKAVLSALDKNFTSTMAKANLLLDGMNQKNKTLSATSGKVTSGFKSVAAALGVIKVASAAFNVLSNSMDKAVSRYDTLNRFPKVLQQIGFSAEDSSQAMKELSDGTKGLPTALDEVASTAQRIAVLTGNLKKATKTTIALNDAFLTSGSSTDDAKRGLTQYIQMLSKGSVDIMSWRTLQETMGVALNDVAKAFGYAGVSAQNDLYDALKSGEITFDQFNEKLIELDGGVNGFAARAKTASGGIATAFKNAQTAVTRGMTGILSAIDTVLQSNGLPNIEGCINRIGTIAEAGLNKVQTFIESFAEADTAVAKIQNLIKVLTPVAPMLALGGAGASLDGIIPAISKVNGGMNSVVNTVGDVADKIRGASRTTTIFGKALAGKLEPGSKKFEKLNGETQNFVKKIIGMKQVLRGKMDFESDGFKKLNKDTKESLERLDAVRNKAIDVGHGIQEKFWKVSATVGSFIPDSVHEKMEGLKSVAGKATTAVKGKFNALADRIPASFYKIGKGVGKGLYTSASAGTKALSSMVSMMGLVFKAALASVGPVAILGLVVAGLGLINGKFGAELTNMLALAREKGPEVISSFSAGIVSQLPGLAATGSRVLAQILTTIASLLPSITTAGIDILNALVQGVTGNMNVILTSMLTLVGAIGNAVISLAPQLLLCGLSILESLTQGILNNMPVILTGISALFDNLTSAITTYLPQMIQQGLVIIENLATGIALALPEIIAAAINTITALVDTLSSNTGQVIDSAVRIINTLADGLLNNLPKILSAAAKLVVAIAKAIITNLPQILTAGIQIVSKLTSGLISATPQVLSAAGKVVTGVFNAFTKTNWLSVGVNIIRGIANGISSSAGALWNAAKGVLGSFKDKVLAFFGIHSPARWGVYVGKMIDLGVGGGLEKYTSKISNVAAKVFDVVSDTFTTGNMNFEALAADGIGTFTIRDMCRKDVQLQEQGGTFENKMKYTIYVPVEIDGKQVAKASAVYTQEELEKLDKQNRRKSGVR